MTEEEIKQKLEDIKLKMFWMINPNGENIFHLTEIELNLIQQQSFNLGVTLSAENAEIIVNSFKQEGKSKEQYEDITSDEYQTEHKNLDGKSKLCISVKPSKDSILKLLIK